MLLVLQFLLKAVALLYFATVALSSVIIVFTHVQVMVCQSAALYE